MSLRTTKARHSRDSPDWYTPAAYVEAARAVMGQITCDPASDREANRRIRATRFYTAEDDGLTRIWNLRSADCVLLNPPGGLVRPFWDKLVRTYLASGSEWQAIWIGYSLEQLQTLQVGGNPSPLDYTLCFPRKRIAFVENAARTAHRLAARLAAKGGQPANSPSHANYVCYLGQQVARFAEVFSVFGTVIY